MTYPHVSIYSAQMNGRHVYRVRLTEYSYAVHVTANTEEDAIEIATLKDQCTRLDKRVKELEAQLAEPDPNVEHDYTYAPT